MERIQNTTEMSHFQVEKAAIMHDAGKFSTLFQQHLSQQNTMESSFSGQSEATDEVSDEQDPPSTYQEQPEIDATELTNTSSLSNLSEVTIPLETENVNKPSAEKIVKKVQLQDKSDLTEQPLENTELTEFVRSMPRDPLEKPTGVSHSFELENATKLTEFSEEAPNFSAVAEKQDVFIEQSELPDDSTRLSRTDGHTLEETSEPPENMQLATEELEILSKQQTEKLMTESSVPKLIPSISQVTDDLPARVNLITTDNSVRLMSGDQQSGEKAIQSIEVSSIQQSSISEPITKDVKAFQETESTVRMATDQVPISDSTNSQLLEETRQGDTQSKQSVRETELIDSKGSATSQTATITSSNMHKEITESQPTPTQAVEGQKINQETMPMTVHIDVPKLAKGNSETIEKIAETFAKPVVKELKSIVRPNEKVFTFDLAPDYLGKVQIKMKVTAQTVSLEFTVQSEQAKKALETITPSFDKVLQKQEQVPIFSVTRTGEAPMATSSENQFSQNFQQNFSQERHTSQQQRSSVKYKRPVEEVTEPEIEARVSILA